MPVRIEKKPDSAVKTFCVNSGKVQIYDKYFEICIC